MWTSVSSLSTIFDGADAETNKPEENAPAAAQMWNAAAEEQQKAEAAEAAAAQAKAAEAADEELKKKVAEGTLVWFPPGYAHTIWCGSRPAIDIEEHWISDDLSSLLNDYFTRYDLDGSGTYNSNDELKQLCTNLVVKLEPDMDIAEIDRLVSTAGDMEAQCWDLHTTKQWFLETFHVNRFWMQNDMSDSDSEGDEVDGFLREGTYNVCLSSAGFADVTFDFRVRYQVQHQLFARVYNDEALGYDVTTKESILFKGVQVNEPYGLHEMRGCVNNDDNSIHFEKVYLYDKDWPKFVFDGQKDGIHTRVKGAWECKQPLSGEATPMGRQLCGKLKVGTSGTFTMVKNPKDDEDD